MEVLLNAVLHFFLFRKPMQYWHGKYVFIIFPYWKNFHRWFKKMCRKKFKQYIGLIIVMVIACINSYGQTPTDSLPPDPGALAVSTVQGMKFGAFYVRSGGGTVSVLNNGTRSFTGNMVLLNLGMLFSQAIFDVEAPQGTIISIWNGPDATLTGSGGGSITLHINDSSPSSPFSSTVAPPGKTSVNIGGTITIPSGSIIAGNYSGTFYITFNNE